MEQTNRQDIVPFTFAKFVINEYIFFCSPTNIHSLSTTSSLVSPSSSSSSSSLPSFAILCCIHVEREDVTKFASHFTIHNTYHTHILQQLILHIISWPSAILSKHICVLYTNLFSNLPCRSSSRGKRQCEPKIPTYIEDTERGSSEECEAKRQETKMKKNRLQAATIIQSFRLQFVCQCRRCQRICHKTYIEYDLVSIYVCVRRVQFAQNMHFVYRSRILLHCTPYIHINIYIF